MRFCNEALDIQAAGGMAVFGGDRKRTAGGVYFYLLKRDRNTTREQKDYIFGETFSRGMSPPSLTKKEKKKRE